MFTKQELADNLRTELTKNGKHLAISQQTLQNQVDTLFDLLVTDETDIADAVAKIKPMFITLNGNYEKDNADFAKKWEKEHQKPQETKLEETSPENKELSEVLKELQSLKAELALSKTEKAVTAKRTELTAAFNEKGIKDKAWITSYLKKLNVTEDTDIEAETNDALAIYNISRADVKDIPSPTGAGNGGEDKSIEDYAAKIAKSMRR